MDPLRTIHLASFPLRIYASPLKVPDHPWASFDDLAALANMDSLDCDRWMNTMRRDVPDMVHVAQDGTRLVAEPMVGGLFFAWVQMGADRAQELLDAWTDAWSLVFVDQWGHLPRAEWLRVVNEAGLRNTPNVQGHTIAH